MHGKRWTLFLKLAMQRRHGAHWHGRSQLVRPELQRAHAHRCGSQQWSRWQLKAKLMRTMNVQEKQRELVVASDRLPKLHAEAADESRQERSESFAPIRRLVGNNTKTNTIHHHTARRHTSLLVQLQQHQQQQHQQQHLLFWLNQLGETP